MPTPTIVLQKEFVDNDTYRRHAVLWLCNVVIESSFFFCWVLTLSTRPERRALGGLGCSLLGSMKTKRIQQNNSSVIPCRKVAQTRGSVFDRTCWEVLIDHFFLTDYLYTNLLEEIVPVNLVQYTLINGQLKGCANNGHTMR